MPLVDRKDTSQPYLNQDDLNWLVSRLNLQRAQLEDMSEHLTILQQVVSRLTTEVEILKDRYQLLRRQAQNKCYAVELVIQPTSILHTLDD